MDEDENLANNDEVTNRNDSVNQPQEDQQVTADDFDDDDDLLDTIEVTVTTDGAPLPPDDSEDIEEIVVSGITPQEVFAGISNLRPDLVDFNWDAISNEETDDAMNTGPILLPSTSARASSSSATQNDEAASGSSGSGSGSGGGAIPSYCFDNPFRLRTRKEVAALINAECCRGGPTPDLNYIMDRFFNPSTPIDNPDNISWIRFLIAGGRTIKEFVKISKSF